MTDRIQNIAVMTGVSPKGAAAVLDLLEQGNTIPFITRYRKEATGGLDEVQVLAIQKQSMTLQEIESRRQAIKKKIARQGKLSEGLLDAIETAKTLAELEDLYLPYKPKKRTKASIAKLKGLEPLARRIYRQSSFDIEKEAEAFISADVQDTDQAIEGACHIIAEWISEDPKVRAMLRRVFEKKAFLCAKVQKGMEEAGKKYKDYFSYQQALSAVSSHRFLAIQRAKAEKVLKVSLEIDEKECIRKIQQLVLRSENSVSALVKKAAADSYMRLLGPSMENESMGLAKARADEEAIQVFAGNLRQLLLAPYLGSKRILAIDPGYRTGCKFVVLNAQGGLLEHGILYLHIHDEKIDGLAKEREMILQAIKDFGIEAVAVGNGTASRQTLRFVRETLKDLAVKVFLVSESGASIYSASPVAREEFPDQDATVRGAISIGRRLMDPLAELLKIEPRSIGVGQYQHDVDQSKLAESLDFVVESCVNSVGVDLNTASVHLLRAVSGLGPKTAKNIVDFRQENGPFAERRQLLDVPNLGPKVFEQCAGFLRIHHGKNPLDASAVHPESYEVVERIARDMGLQAADLVGKDIRQQIDIRDYADEKTGILTLQDILQELAKPGRDPREQAEDFAFHPDVLSIKDIRIGMVLKGIVNNITDFGAFVDLGIKDAGLIHISEMASRYIRDPHEAVSMDQKVDVKVIGIDLERKRISLSLKALS